MYICRYVALYTKHNTGEEGGGIKNKTQIEKIARKLKKEEKINRKGT